MQPNDLQKQLTHLMEQVRQDDSLGEDLQNNLTDLITAASADPTPGNLEALAIVFQKLADANKYMAAMTTIQNIQLNDDVVEESPATTQ